MGSCMNSKQSQVRKKHQEFKKSRSPFPITQRGSCNGGLSLYFCEEHWLTVERSEVCSASLAFDGTIVLALVLYQDYDWINICHYSKQGKLLNKKTMYLNYHSFRMLRDDAIVAVSSIDNPIYKGQILIYSLKNYLSKVTSFEWCYKFQIYSFSETDTICIARFGSQFNHESRQDQSIIRMIYYNYKDLIDQKKRFVQQFHDKKISVKGKLINGNIQDIDSHSSLMWASFDDSVLKVYIYDIKNEKGQLQTISLGQGISMKILWKFGYNKDTVSFLGSFIKKNRKKQEHKQYKVRRITLDKQNNKMNELSQKQSRVINSIESIQVRGDYSISVLVQLQKILVLSFSYYDEIHQSTQNTVLVFDSQTGACLGKEMKQAQQQDLQSIWYHKVGWRKTMLIESALVVNSGMEENLRLRVFNTELTYRDAFLLMLLHLNEDFDDDLLQEAIELLVE